MNFALQFNMDNDAFVDSQEYEVMRILDSVKDNVRNGAVSGVIRDTNGNIIGQWSIEE
jgi:hypothetical protein